MFNNAFKKINRTIAPYKEEYLLFGFIIILFAITPLLSEVFLTTNNIMNLLRQISYTSIAAIGMLFVILTGGIDLSIGATIQVVSMTSILLLIEGLPIYVVIIIVLLIGMLIGLLNGLLITFGRLQPFIVTLVTKSIMEGTVLLITGAGGISGAIDKAFLKIGAGYFGIFPVPVVITASIVLICGFIVSKTVYGRKLYAVGSNKAAAYGSGINVIRVQISSYVVSALLASVAGVLVISRTGAFQPTTTHGGATGMELSAIAAVVVGGARLAGGKGSVFGAFLGALLSGLLFNLLVLLDINSYIQQLFLGLIIMFAVIVSASERRKEQ